MEFCEDKIYNELDIDKLNEEYFIWMAAFEKAATPEQGYPLDMDVNYSVVDQMFEENITPDDAVKEYWNRIK